MKPIFLNSKIVFPHAAFAMVVCTQQSQAAQFLLDYDAPGLSFRASVDSATDRLTIYQWASMDTGVGTQFLNLNLTASPLTFSAMLPEDFPETTQGFTALTPTFDIPTDWDGTFGSAAGVGWLFVAETPTNQLAWVHPEATTSTLQGLIPEHTRLTLGGTENGSLSLTTDFGRAPKFEIDEEFGPSVHLEYSWQGAISSVQSIPEPSFLRLVIGLAGLGLIMRRRHYFYR